MLIMGSIHSIPKIDNLMILNLTSGNNMFPLVDLIDPICQADFDDAFNDDWYFREIFNSDHYFMELMKIMEPLYEGKNVYLIINEIEEIQLLNEMVTHLITSRYGYPVQHINSILDFDEMDDSTFSFCGIQNMDADRGRMFQILNI